MHASRLQNPKLRIALFLAALLIGGMVMAMLGALLVYAMVGSEASQWFLAPGRESLLVVYYLPQLIFSISLVSLFRRGLEGGSLASLGLDEGPLLRHLLRGVFIGVLLITLIYLVLWLPGWAQSSAGNLGALSLFWLTLFFAMVAVAEELVFRGYLLTTLRTKIPPASAVGLSSLMFTLVHLGNSDIGAFALLNIYLAGWLLGTVRLYRGGLWLAMGVHLGWNMMQGPVLGLAVSGLPMQGLLQTTLEGADWLTGAGFGLEGSVLVSLGLLAALFILYPRK